VQDHHGEPRHAPREHAHDHRCPRLHQPCTCIHTETYRFHKIVSRKAEEKTPRMESVADLRCGDPFLF
jgi:hypothetical protein